MKAELLAPAGDFETALAAFDAGADAVYCGMRSFSARAFAKNFSEDDLKNLMRVARAKGRKVYVTFNTLVKEDGVEEAVRELSALDEIHPDALIVQDLGIARLARKYFPGLELHASTQLVTHNLAGVMALKELGFSRVVPARELSAAEVEFLVKRSGGMEFECFIHGALCYSISGLCLFSALEKGRSGNCGQCAYCCRLPYEDANGRKVFPFSMKDLRLGEDVKKLVDAGVASLKIEGRMKSALYVASVVKWYRQILDRVELGSDRVGARSDKAASRSDKGPKVTLADLETVFSRRTTELYLNGRPTNHQSPTTNHQSPIDPTSLGHLGAAIGTVKRVTRDREGGAWLRFHTSRALEKHDGLQFASPDGGKPLGFGITLMRQAISRTPVFEVAAGTDVEILIPEAAPSYDDRSGGRRPQQGAGPSGTDTLASRIRPGSTVYCSMSNAVKRMFPAPSFRPSDYEGGVAIDLKVVLGESAIKAVVDKPCKLEVEIPFAPQKAQHPEKTAEGVRKALAKLGETDYRLGRLVVDDPAKLYAPMSVLNDLRRDIVERLDDVRREERSERLERALGDEPLAPEREGGTEGPMKRIKLRPGQKLPAGDWDEVVYAIDAETRAEELAPSARLALPVFTPEGEFGRLRVAVKRLVRSGFAKWEVADLATLHMLKELGISDITADWTLYAMNASALKALSDMGVKRFVASPENDRSNLAFLAESGYDVEFLTQESTPLFISLTRPEDGGSGLAGQLAYYERNGLWISTKKTPRTFDPPEGVSTRADLSWDAI